MRYYLKTEKIMEKDEFILVQLPEPTEEKFKTIAGISKARI